MKLSRFLQLLILSIASAFGNSYVYQPLKKLPAGSEIIAFSNGLLPGDGKRRQWQKEDLVRFLDKGVRNENRKEWPARVNEWNGMQGWVCDGVFADKGGKVYFWTLVEPDGILVETSAGESAFLQIKK